MDTPPAKESAFSVAKLRFIDGLERKSSELSLVIGELESKLDSAPLREDARKRLHALYASAQVFRLATLSASIESGLTRLDAARERGRLERNEHAVLRELAASLVATAKSELHFARQESQSFVPPAFDSLPAPAAETAAEPVPAPEAPLERESPVDVPAPFQLAPSLIAPPMTAAAKLGAVATLSPEPTADSVEAAAPLAPEPEGPSRVAPMAPVARSADLEPEATVAATSIEAGPFSPDTAPPADPIPAVAQAVAAPSSPSTSSGQTIAPRTPSTSSGQTIAPRTPSTSSGQTIAPKSSEKLSLEDLGNVLVSTPAAQHAPQAPAPTAAEEPKPIPSIRRTARLESPAAAMLSFAKTPERAPEPESAKPAPTPVASAPKKASVPPPPPPPRPSVPQRAAAAPPEPTAKPAALKADGTLLRGRTILVVDDDPTAQSFFASVMRMHGASVIEVGTGAEAISLLRTREIDAVLSDVWMPKIDGVALAQTMRRDPALAHVPLVLLSWKEDLLERVRAFGIHAAAFLRKETSEDEIARVLAGALSARTELETKLARGGEVRGDLSAVGALPLARMTANKRKEARVVVRSAWNLYELTIDNHRIVDATRTALDGSFVRGTEALVAWAGTTTGRYEVLPGAPAPRNVLEGSVSDVLLAATAELSARIAAVSGMKLFHIERLVFDEDLVVAIEKASPPAVSTLVERLHAGATPRELLSTGETSVDLVESTLIDLARSGALRRVIAENNVDLTALVRDTRRDEAALTRLTSTPLRVSVVPTPPQAPSKSANDVAAVAEVAPAAEVSAAPTVEITPAAEVAAADAAETSPVVEAPLAEAAASSSAPEATLEAAPPVEEVPALEAAPVAREMDDETTSEIELPSGDDEEEPTFTKPISDAAPAPVEAPTLETPLAATSQQEVVPSLAPAASPAAPKRVLSPAFIAVALALFGGGFVVVRGMLPSEPAGVRRAAVAPVRPRATPPATSAEAAAPAAPSGALFPVPVAPWRTGDVSKVLVDGQEVDSSAETIELSVGVHDLELKRADGISYAYRVIEVGQAGEVATR